jgi:integrase
MMATINKYQNTSGAKFYMVRYRTPDNRQTDKRGFSTKRDAQAFAATVETAKLRGEYVAPSGGRVMVGELGPAWLDRQRGHLKAASFRTYESAWATNVEPRWGATPIAAIRHSDVSAWAAQLSSRRSAEIVRKAHRVLAAILNDAVRDRLIATNPATGVKLPARAPSRHVYLTAAQLERLATESGEYESLIWLLGTVGCRWGEAVALRTEDVDFLRRRIELHSNAVLVNGKMIVGTLKSNKNRTVPVAGFVIEHLAAICRGREDLLWPSPSGGYMRPPRVRSWFSAAVKRCQATDPSFPRVTAHDLRHTATSLAISAGANVKGVQKMLGHASAAMTLDIYCDLFDSDLDAVAVNVGDIFTKAAATNRR